MHNKTFLSVLGWLLPVGGWFLWTLVLSALFKPTPGKPTPLYPIYRSFIDGFGGDLLWWLVIFLALASLILFEIGVSSIRKSFWPTDTDVFQELQNDKLIRDRFEETIRREAEGSVTEIEMGREVKSSMEARREDEIQELLDRPRVMNVVGAEAVHSPIEMNDSVSAGVSRSASGHLKKRKFSVDTTTTEGLADAGQIGIGARSSVLPKTRHSIDIAELLGRRTGSS
jgi:phospholipid-translocating ATPase